MPPTTIKKALEKAQQILQNIELKSLEAEVLLSHTLNRPKEYLFSHEEEPLSESQLKTFLDNCQRRQSGEPIAHITNTKEFFGIDLYIDNRVLIPRPETELLVEEILNFTTNHNTKNIIEIGTGSGNISIAIAKNTKNIQIIAGEFSKEALEVAKINVKKHSLEDKIELRHSDLLKNIPESAEIIVANLPYIGKEKNNFVSQEASEKEPHIALFGGSTGLELYEQLFTQIKTRPEKPKLITGEFGFTQGEGIKQLLNHFFPNHKNLVKQDLAGLDRYFVSVLQ